MIFSQHRDFMEVSNEHLNEPIYNLEKNNDNRYLKENRSGPMSQAIHLNSTSVVDSVLATRENGNVKFSYNYDADGNMTLELSETWDGSQWVNYLRTVYTFDSNKNMTSQFFEYWDGNQWVKSYRYTYTYDPNGIRTRQIYERRVEEQLVNDSRDTFTYDSNGNMISILSENWNESQ